MQQTPRGYIKTPRDGDRGGNSVFPTSPRDRSRGAFFRFVVGPGLLGALILFMVKQRVGGIKKNEPRSMYLLESPWPVISFGISIEVVLAILLLATRRGVLLGWMLGVAACVGLGVLVEWIVVTDREAIDDALHDCAAAIETNDVDRVLAHVSPRATSLQSEVREIMGRVEVSMMRIFDLEITVNRQADPRTAKSVFKAVGKGRDRKGEFPIEQAYKCKVTVNFRREGKQWFATDYEREDLDLPK
jgi:hypothetical protein